MAKTLLLIAHAPSLNTQAMLTAMIKACESAELEQVRCVTKTPFDVDDQLVRGAAGLLLFTPENFGYMSGAMKDFFDRNYYALLDRTQGLPYCLCVRGGQDGTGAVSAVQRITTGLRWRQVLPPLICQGGYQTQFCLQTAEYAATFAQGLELGIY